MNVKKMVVLACCIVGGVMPVVVGLQNNNAIAASEVDFTEYTYENLEYIVDEDETIIITDCDESATEVVIPSEIDGMPVIKISFHSFSGCSNLKSVTIPDSITSIGTFAFLDCSSLTDIIIPDSVTIIGDDAFSWCSSLTDITIPDSITSIGTCVFSGCSSLESITIPDSVTSIGYSAFSDCSSLKSITIPDSVTSINSIAFWGCSSLTDIIISDNVIDIGGYTFSGTPWLKTKQEENPIVIVNNILIDGTTCSGDTIIPEGVTSINVDAFRECSSITNITIPDSVTIIDNNAFRDCSGLTDITIPDSVISIEYGAFCNCSSLADITIENPYCKIYHYPDIGGTAISNSDEKISSYYKFYFNGTIHGYKNSTAQAYAKINGYKFESLGDAPGDANSDGRVTIADAVALQKYLLGTGSLSGWKSADLCEDGRIDVFDLCLLKQMLVQKK